MMNASRLLSAAALLSAVAVASGCGGAGLDVDEWHRAPVHTGPTRQLFLADAYGPRDALYETRGIARDQIAERGWFTLTDSDARALSLEIDVLEWFTATNQEARDGVDDAGNPVTVIVDVESAHAYLAATLFDADGDVLLDDFEVEGIHTEDGSFADERAALDEAAGEAMVKVFDQITPTRSEAFIPFDDRDDEEKPILEQAQQGRVAGALGLEENFIASHPGRAAPLYNRAVMLEATGDFDGAVAGYDDALAARPDDTLRDLAVAARAGCVERRANASALGL